MNDGRADSENRDAGPRAGEDTVLLDGLAAFLASEALDSEYGLTLKNISGRRIDAAALTNDGSDMEWSSENKRDYGENLRDVLKQIIGPR